MIYIILMVIIICSCYGVYANSGMENANLVPFVLPWDDSSTSITNVSNLISKPAGNNGFVYVKDGHLYQNGNRIKFLGTNITTMAAFPYKADAPKIAARLAKFGINCIRFHHMDSNWGMPFIFKNDLITLDPEQLDKLDYFIYQLKLNEIYSDINLHVGREYPRMLKWQGQPDFFKAVDIFYTPMIEMQKQYARELLTHFNPYTQSTYINEPAVAFIEINNEDGSLNFWNWAALDNMPDIYKNQLRLQWNRWLRLKYKSPQQVLKAWKAKSIPLGAEILKNGNFSQGLDNWVSEQHNNAITDFSVQNDISINKKYVHINVTQASDQGWHVQFGQGGLALKMGDRYTVSFYAKASQARKISVIAAMAHDPWQWLWSNDLKLSTDWKKFEFTLFPSADEANARIIFSNMGNQTGSVDIADISLKTGGTIEYLKGANLKNLPFITKAESYSLQKEILFDWESFLWDIEKNYFINMRKLIKNELNSKSLVIGTAVGFSPSLIQAEMDVVDSHAYWQHPVFPGIPWDSNNWYVNNIPMAGRDDGGTLPSLGMARVIGKPFIVTEYNHPAPNTYSSEAFLLLSSYAAMQDWDGIFEYSYQGDRDTWDCQMIPNYFELNQHPTKLAIFPAAAAIFLRGDVKPVSSKIAVKSTKAFEIYNIVKNGVWVNAQSYGLMPLDTLSNMVGVTRGSSFIRNANQNDSGFAWKTDKYPGASIINTQKTKAVIGASEGYLYNLDEVSISTKPNAQNWSAITLTVLEGSSFDLPGRILVTATGYTENTKMGWKNPEKSTVGSDWGQAPSLIDCISAEITLPVSASKVTAWSLDSSGQRVSKMTITGNNNAIISIGSPYNTLWYEVEIK